MKRWFCLLSALAVLAPAVAQASPVTLLTVCANDTCQDLSGMLTSSGSEISSIDTTVTLGDVASLQITGLLDADPFISFGATTTVLTDTTVTFAFLFGTPIVPGFYNTASSTGSLSLTGVIGGTANVATGQVYPTFISGYGTLGLVPTNLGVDLGTTACSSVGGDTACSFGSLTNTFGPTFYDNLEALLTYTQSQQGSVASWSGAVTLTDVPNAEVAEPGSLTLLGLGVAGLVARRRRQRARSTLIAR